MSSATLPASRPLSLWRDLVCPREHGSWSLAFEPIALGLLVAPSVGGAWFAAALAALFFARRPARAALLEVRPDRHALAVRTLAALVIAAGTALAFAVVAGGTAWLPALAPVALAGAAFAWCDARGEGRAEFAELAGATAFALTPVAFGLLGGLPVPSAVALGLLMTFRSAPSVAAVRAFLRAAKTGERRDAAALALAVAGFAFASAFASAGFAPWLGAGFAALFVVRSYALLVWLRPAWRARTLGMVETALGLAFVAGLAATWPR